MRVVLLTIALALSLAACGDQVDDPPAVGAQPGTIASPAFALTDDLGCGHLLAKVDADQEALLLVLRESDRPLTREVSLPDAGWDAALRIGEHLAANWCNDVILEPEAEVEETWPVVEGTLRFVGPLPPESVEQGGPTEVRAELTGVVVESPDGERVELGDISVTNRQWGFFAG